jgi:hypothetical protein
MSLANETDFGERVSVIRTSILSSLNELQTIIDKSLPHAYAYSHVESERLRQQTRANLEAVRACEAEDRIRDLECAISMIIEKAERNPSANDVLAIARTAMRPNSSVGQRDAAQPLLGGVNDGGGTLDKPTP